MLGLAFAALVASTLAVSPISIKGAKFYNGDGSQYFIKGIAYQLTNDDPLAQPEQCQLDASLMQTLGTNAIRVYHVDPTANHDACMSTFADAGIFVFLDMDTFATYILQGGVPRWTSSQFDAFAAVMDAFQGYDNLGGFFVGNEVLNVGADSDAAPFVKAAARDMKAYRDSKGYRKIPVGYSATDSAELRPNLQNYLACGDNAAETVDFFSLNAYEWCGDSTFDASGYAALQQNASEYNIPIFFSETGCNVPMGQPRTFEDQDSILGPDMDSSWSGAIIYEWIQETNAYGLISYGPPAGTAVASNVVAGFTRAGTPTPINPDFENLSNRWKTLNPTGTPAADYSPSLSPPACPSSTPGLWNVDGNVPLPTLNEVVQTSGTVGTVSTGVTTTGTPSVSGSSSDASNTTDPSPATTTTQAGAATREVAVSGGAMLLVIALVLAL